MPTPLKGLALAVLLATASPLLLATASGGPSHPLTLAEAVRLALRQAPEAQAADAGLAVADADVAIASLRPNPVLAVEAENIDGSGIYDGGAEREATAVLEFPLELGGKRASRRRVAEAERDAVRIEADAIRADVALQATLAFIEAAAAEHRLALARERLALAQAAFDAADKRVRAGTASPIETQRADVARLDADLAVARRGREATLARAQLARLTGIAVVSSVSAPWFERIDQVESAVSPSAARSLGIALADAELSAARARLDAAQRARMPDITLSAGMRHAQAPDDTAAIVGIAVPLPVFNSGRAAVARARAALQLAEARRTAAVRAFERDRDAALAAVETAGAIATSASGPALAAAREAARIARIGYAAGKFSQLERIEAERVLTDTRAAALDALIAYHEARARLRRLDGQIDGTIGE